MVDGEGECLECFAGQAASADCGPGFDCVEERWYTCSAEGGSDGSSDGVPDGIGMADKPAPSAGGAPDVDAGTSDGSSSCTDEPSGYFYCQLQQVACESDSDCASGLTCQESGQVCWGGGSYSEDGTEVVEEATAVCDRLAQQYPKATIISGKLVFRQERMFHRLLHNETPTLIQRRLQWLGVPMVVLPVRANV